MPAKEGVASDSLLSRVANNEWIPPGLFFMALGAAALWVSRDYQLGNLHRMGTGYFPRMLSIGMIGLGVMIFAKGIPELAGAKGIDGRLERSFWLIPASMVVFGFSIEPLGLVIALALTTIVAGVAHRQVRIKEIVISAIALNVLTVLIFVLVLKLPLHLWPDL
jgi:hypothetical protein